MAIKEQDIVFTTKDESGNTIIQMPITRAGNIEDVMSIQQGGTGSGTASGARTNLGLATAVTDASISGKTITLTKANGTTQTLITQDTAPFTASATSIGGASATKPAVVVTTYESGTSGYRVWSDGYIEQWGRAPKNGTGVTVTFLKAFKTTNYNVTMSDLNYNDTWNSGCKDLTTTSMYVYLANNNGNMWRACGR